MSRAYGLRLLLGTGAACDMSNKNLKTAATDAGCTGKVQALRTVVARARMVL